MHKLIEKINYLQSQPENIIYDANLEALKNRYHKLYEKVVQTPFNENEYTIFKNKTDLLKNLFDEKNKTVCYDIDKPIETIKKYFDDKSVKFTRMAGFLGIGLGYELIYYMNYCFNEYYTEKVFVVEKDINLFIYALKQTDLTKLIDNIHIRFFVGLDEESFSYNFQQYIEKPELMEAAHTISIWENNFSFNNNKTYYVDIVKRLSGVIRNVIERKGNSVGDSLLGVRNTFENLDYILKTPGINHLYGKLKGMPAVIVSSGPSLKDNIHLIEGLRNKALILSAESTLKILMLNGTKPHIMCTTERDERKEALVEHFSWEGIEDVYMAACSVIPHTMMERFGGKRLMAYRYYPYCQWLGIDRGMKGFGASSSSMALEVAASFGCNPIILIGQDLCYERESMQSHTEGHGAGAIQFQKRRMFKMPTNDNDFNFTNDIWFLFKSDLERYIREYNVTCINTAEQGLVIEGSQYMPLQEAIDTYLTEEIDPIEKIENALRDFEPVSYEYKQELIEKFHSVIEDINFVMDICEEAIDFISSCHDTFDCALESKIITPQIIEKEKEALSIIDGYIEKIGTKKTTYVIFIYGLIHSINDKNETDIFNTPQKYDDYAYALMVMIFKYKKYFADMQYSLLYVLKEMNLGLRRLECPSEEISEEDLNEEFEYEYDNDLDCSPYLDYEIRKKYFNEDIKYDTVEEKLIKNYIRNQIELMKKKGE